MLKEFSSFFSKLYYVVIIICMMNMRLFLKVQPVTPYVECSDV